MPLSQNEAKQLLERLIFADSSPEDWVQDVWALSPTLGETAARLVDGFNGLIHCAHQEKLENLLQDFYQDAVDE